MTVAVLLLKDTATLATPGTASRLPLTMEGQAAQYILFTANVIVLSAAIAADEATMAKVNAAWARSLFMGTLRSRVEKERRDEVEGERDDDEDRCEDEACFDDAIRQRARAGLAIGAGAR